MTVLGDHMIYLARFSVPVIASSSLRERRTGSRVCLIEDQSLEAETVYLKMLADTFELVCSVRSS